MYVCMCSGLEYNQKRYTNSRLYMFLCMYECMYVCKRYEKCEIYIHVNLYS